MTDTPTFLQEPVPTGLAEYEATAREFVKELHPLAQAFPVVTGTAGVTRQRILQELGLKPRYEVLPANIDPIDYVIAANLRRRQLTPAQRALIGAKLAALQRGDNQHSSRELPSQAAIAEKLDVSISSIKRARTIKATGATAVLEEFLLQKTSEKLEQVVVLFSREYVTRPNERMLVGLLFQITHDFVIVNRELNPKGQVPEDWSAYKKAKLMAYKGMPLINLFKWSRTLAREEGRFYERKFVCALHDVCSFYVRSFDAPLVPWPELMR
jgi:hypothetical protein